MYVPNSLRVGRDSIRVRSMSRIANSVIAETSAPGTLSSRSTTDVRSAPVLGGGGPGGPDQHEAGPGVGLVDDVGRPVRSARTAARPARCSRPRRRGRRRHRWPPRRSSWPVRAEHSAGWRPASCVPARWRRGTPRRSDVRRGGARAHDDAERDVERQLGEDLQRPSRSRGCPASAAPTPRSSSRSARTRSRRRRSARRPAPRWCCPRHRGRTRRTGRYRAPCRSR